MDYDFQVEGDKIRIPQSEYRPFKRCSFCQSVFINDLLCESCGRLISYHPIGEPLSAKSFYGIKEQQLLNTNIFFHYFPWLEKKNSLKAARYLRRLDKRLFDLTTYLNTDKNIPQDYKKIFLIEVQDILEEIDHYKKNILLDLFLWGLLKADFFLKSLLILVVLMILAIQLK